MERQWGGGGVGGLKIKNKNKVKYKAIVKLAEIYGEQGWRSGRALASHQCGLGLIPGLGVICGPSLLVLNSAPRGF